MKEKRVIVVRCEEDGREAVYVDGKLVKEADSISVRSVCAIAGTKPFRLRWYPVFRGDRHTEPFPATYKEMRAQDREAIEDGEMDCWIKGEIERNND